MTHNEVLLVLYAVPPHLLVQLGRRELEQETRTRQIKLMLRYGTRYYART